LIALAATRRHPERQRRISSIYFHEDIEMRAALTNVTLTTLPRIAATFH
jgi:hypothetical protein